MYVVDAAEPDAGVGPVAVFNRPNSTVANGTPQTGVGRLNADPYDWDAV